MTRSLFRTRIAAVAVTGTIAIGLAGVAVAQAQDTPAARYAKTLADADVTARYNAHIELLLKSQQTEMAALEQQIAGLDATAAEVQPLLQRMFDELNTFITADVPFHSEERHKRIDTLRQTMERVDATPAEKFRRLLEAYQIEMEFGRTMDAYREKLADGREADFVRLGRVSLMYRTVEAPLETGYWDNDKKAWVADPNYARAIDQALRIAKQESAPDLLEVPVPAAQGGRS